jgi:hypothetical protein
MRSKKTTTRLVFCSVAKKMVRREVEMPIPARTNPLPTSTPSTLAEERRARRRKEMYEFVPTSENEKLMMLIHTYGANNVVFG